MKRFFAVLLLFTSLSATSQVSDTLHVSHYAIQIDSMNFIAQTIAGKTTLTIHSKQNNVSTIPLRLFRLVVDSVVCSSQNVSHAYNDTVISISLTQALQQNDSIVIDVHYHGQPKQDPSYGGFYFSGNMAFNLGVAINLLPHNFGSAWYPCIDEFTDKSTYTFDIKTEAGMKAFCNGILDTMITEPDSSLRWQWSMNQPIPTYLVSIAVGPFYTLTGDYNGLPVEHACLIGDTTRTKNTFQNFDTVMAVFEEAYGPYPFDKVGFVQIPFNNGAMEHATSVHIGRAFVDGTLNYEFLWVHELSHMWWGDMVTCTSAQDMWLNEGFAEYNGMFYKEKIYSLADYMNVYRANHRDVLQFMHINDQGYHPLNNIPDQHTYSTTVYNRGADVVHTLRKIMGDSLFFAASKAYMSNLAYGNASSLDMIMQFAAASGLNLTPFYDGWISNGGFPHWSVDSVQSVPNGSDFDVTVYLRQRQKGNTHLYTTPVEVTFSDGTSDTTVSVTMSALTDQATFTLSFDPVWTAVDRNEKLSDAVADCEKVITTSGTINFEHTDVSLNVTTAGAGSTVRIENNFVRPDDFINTNPGIRLSTYHYFSIDGIFDPAFHASATFGYDGRTTSNAVGHLDDDILTGTEDSLLILYRQSPDHEWMPVLFATQNFIGSHTDKRGTFTVDTLQKGEYVFGYRDFTASVVEMSSGETIVFPNPSSDVVFIRIDSDKFSEAEVFDLSGRHMNLTGGFNTGECRLDLTGIPGGVYIVKLKGERIRKTMRIVKM